MIRSHVRVVPLVILALSCQQKPATTSPAAGSAAQGQARANDDASLAAFSDPVIRKVVELGRSDSRVQDHARHLSVEIGPRLTSSHNLIEAENWCRDQMAGWGLDARLEPWGEFPVGFDRGPSSGGMVAPEVVDYEFTTRAWAPGRLGPVRGRALPYPKTRKELKALEGRLEGAWIIQTDPRAGRRSRGQPPRRDKNKERIDAALAKAKIAGQIVRARDKDGKLVRTWGRSQIEWNELPNDVLVYLRGDQFDDLVKRMGGGQEVEIELSIDNRFFNGPVKVHNVVADIKGSTWPDQYVIVGGHIDSWDGAQGAVDNATGVATTMEAARLLMAAGAKPKRTIRFMLWSGEEQGLLGSKGYVERNPGIMDKISAVLVHDGGTNYLSGIQVTPEMMADAKQVFAPVMKLDAKMPFEIKETDSLRPGGSDHSPFIRAGVPGFFWDQAGDSVYRVMHHTQNDNFDRVIPRYQKHSSLVVAIAAYNLANLDHLLDRTNSAPIARRRMNVDLDGTKVLSVEPKGKGAAAGWKPGDVVLTVDGEKVERMWDMVRMLQKGGPIKKVEIKRGKRTLTTTLDYSGDEAEKERARRREARGRAPEASARDQSPSTADK